MTPTRQTESTQQGGDLLPEAADLQRLWSMARSVGSWGYLHHLVPARPRWCRRIGDAIERALQRNQQLEPFDFERLTYVFDKAQARHKAQLAQVKPQWGKAAYLRRVVDEHGLEYWECHQVPVLPALDAPTMGCA